MKNSLKSKKDFNLKCPKCKKDADGDIFINPSKSLRFCKTCSAILNSFPHPAMAIQLFLKNDKTDEEKNMFEARERRAVGIRAW
jgi:hypothetical protein